MSCSARRLLHLHTWIPPQSTEAISLATALQSKSASSKAGSSRHLTNLESLDRLLKAFILIAACRSLGKAQNYLKNLPGRSSLDGMAAD